nr:sigma 54-interacting transcriptional regulator [candidate division Zixibacteria bacterium]
MSQINSADMEYRRSCQKYLEDLIARRDFAAAGRYFDSIQSVWSGHSDVTSGIIMRLGARAFGSSENLSRALTLIRTAIAVISRADGETSESAECYIVLGNILRDMGKFREAEKAYRDAESIFRRNDNFARAGVALNRLAAVQFRKGEFEAALKCLLEAVEHAKKEGDNKKLAYIFGNIGRVYTLLGKLNQAEENIRFNINLSSELGDEVELARAYLSLGYVKIQKGRYDEAETALNESREYASRRHLNKEIVIYQTYLGELRLRTGRLDEAEEALNEAVAGGNRIAPGSLLAARPMRHLAELYVRQNNIRKAFKTANRALVMMKKIEDQVEIGALHKIIAVCHECFDNTDKARRSFGRAIAVLEECRARFELAESLAAAGQSAVFGTNQQTMYLCRAEEIFNTCGIINRATDIQRLISSLEITGLPISDKKFGFGATESGFPTRNEKMKQVVSHLGHLRETDIPILITGETGTGKDFLARYFHAMARPDGPYVAVNCAAVPDTLIESELFGYQKGAFTGAESNRQGLFLAANHGVILLDEVGELPLMVQAKLLSVLEARKLRPLGTAKEIPLDIIVIAATNRDLHEMAERGDFRRDLYYRLAGITFSLPPLRERKEDIPYLLKLFMQQSGLLAGDGEPEDELVRQFLGYDWPGNIRQMENKVKQLSVMASMAKDGSIVELARSFFETRDEEMTNSLTEKVEQFEKQLLVEALVAARGNKSEAARMLSIHESTFRAKMKRYHLTALAS